LDIQEEGYCKQGPAPKVIIYISNSNNSRQPWWSD